MTPKYDPKYDDLIRSELTLAEVSRQTGVCQQTIANWRRRIRLGLPMPTKRYNTPYGLIDNLLRQGKGPTEIARTVGRSATCISRRMKALRGKKAEPKEDVRIERDIPASGPELRFREALDRKQENMGMDGVTFQWWLQGEGGGQFRRGIAQ